MSTAFLQVLELPTWLRVKRAVCNRIAVKVPWTKLKSQPVKLVIFQSRILNTKIVEWTERHDFRK